MFFWLNKILQGLKMASQTLQTIRNGWAPEIKRLNDNLEKLEASLSGTDECVLDIYSLRERFRCILFALYYFRMKLCQNVEKTTAIHLV